jgi:hypothetical protein
MVVKYEHSQSVDNKDGGHEQHTQLAEQP